MNRVPRWYDPVITSIYFTGLSVLNQTMTPLVVPLLVQQFVGATQQGTFYGMLRLWSLMTALLVQSLMGMLSDRSMLRWGRRRPFIVIGTLLSLACMIGIGFSAGLQGETGYWTLFVLMILLSASSNTGQGSAQGLIPDLVPENQRGVYSAVKSILEIPIPVILVSFSIGRLIAAGQLWLAIMIAMGILAITMIATLWVRERPLETVLPTSLDWKPFLRLILMTAIFTVTILFMGEVVKRLLHLLDSIETLASLMTFMGEIGLFAMLITITGGVWLSIRFGIGQESPHNPSYTWWVINRLAFMVGSINLGSFGLYFVQGRFNLEEAAAAGPASQILLIVGVFILIVSIPAGYLADRFGSKPIVAAAGILATIGTLVLVIAPNLTMVFLGAMIVGAGTGLFFPSSWALGTRLAPKDKAGLYLGVANLAGAGAGAIGAYLGGPIADYMASISLQLVGQGYNVLFGIFGAIFMFSVIALIKVDLPENAPSTHSA